MKAHFILLSLVLSVSGFSDDWTDKNLIQHIENGIQNSSVFKEEGPTEERILEETERHIHLLTHIEDFEGASQRSYMGSFYGVVLIHIIAAGFTSFSPETLFGYDPPFTMGIAAFTSLLIRAQNRWRRKNDVQARPILVGRLQRLLGMMDDRKIDMGLPMRRKMAKMFDKNKSLRETFPTRPDPEKAAKKARSISFGTHGLAEAAGWSALCSFHLSQFLGF